MEETMDEITRIYVSNGRHTEYEPSIKTGTTKSPSHPFI